MVSVAIEASDQLAADYLLGELLPAETDALRRRIDADPAAQQALLRMEAAISALQTWRADFNRLSPPSVPQVRKRWIRHWLLAAAAAAAVLLAAVGWRLLSSPRTPTPAQPASREWAAEEFAGLIVREGSRGESHEMRFSLGVPHAGGVGGGPPGGSGDRGGPEDVEPILQQFARQFDFAFRVPAKLPDGYELERGRPISASAVHLTYSAGGRRLELYLKKSPGSDEPSRQSQMDGDAGPTVWISRRHGVAVAVDGPMSDRESVESLISQFLPQ
jgi:anti-sigma factor RsiW